MKIYDKKSYYKNAGACREMSRGAEVPFGADRIKSSLCHELI